MPFLCSTPKVGNTNIKWYMDKVNDGTAYNYTGDNKMCQIHSSNQWKVMKPMRELSMKEAESMLKTYTKFAFIRHPLDRLLSAWGDKFGPNASISSRLYWVG